MRTLIALLVLSLAATPLAADDDDDLEDPLEGPVRRGTRVTLVAPPAIVPGKSFQMKVVFEIPKGYHIYGPVAEGVKNPTPTIVIPQEVKGVTWGKVIYPKVHKGPFLDKVLEIKLTEYFTRVVVTFPGKLAKDASLDAKTFKIKSAWGTCNEMSCMELFTIARQPQWRTATSRVVWTLPTVEAPAVVERGKPFAVTVTFDVPAGKSIGTPGVRLPAVKGVTWGALRGPVGAKHVGKVTYTISGTVAADAPEGATTFSARLSWRTSGNEPIAGLPYPLTLTIK